MKQGSKIHFVGLIMLFCVFIVVVTLVWYVKKPAHDEALTYLPKNSLLVVKVNTPTLFKEGALKPLFESNLDEEQRKILYHFDKNVQKDGVDWTQTVYFTLEKRKEGLLPILFVHLEDAAAFKLKSKALNWCFANNEMIGVIAFPKVGNELNEQAYLEQIVAKTIPRLAENNSPLKTLAENTLLRIYFPSKENYYTDLEWNKSKNAIEIIGEIPPIFANYPLLSQVKKNGLYLAFPTKQFVGFLPESIIDTNWISKINSLEINYEGSEIDLTKGSFTPHGGIILHFENNFEKDSILNWLQKNELIKIMNDSALIVKNQVKANFKITQSTLAIYNEKMMTSVNNDGMIFKSAGDFLSLFEFYDNKLVNFIASGEPRLKSLKSLFQKIKNQSITIKEANKKQIVNGEITFQKDVNIPFEIIYLLRVFQSN